MIWGYHYYPSLINNNNTNTHTHITPNVVNHMKERRMKLKNEKKLNKDNVKRLQVKKKWEKVL